MNVLISTATEDPTAPEGPNVIERFYPVSSVPQKHDNLKCSVSYSAKEQHLTNSSSSSKSNGKQNGTYDTRPSPNTVVLVDWIKDSFFPDIMNWLTEMGVRNLILASSSSVCETDNESEMALVEQFRRLGVDVHIMQATLSFADEVDIAREVSAITSNVKGIIFSKNVETVRLYHSLHIRLE